MGFCCADFSAESANDRPLHGPGWHSLLPKILGARVVLEKALRAVTQARNESLLEDRRAAAEKAAIDGQRASDRGDAKGLFQIVRSLAGIKPAAATAIRDANGDALTSVADTTARWRSFFTGVFKATVVDSVAELHVPAERPQESTPPYDPTCDDIDGALRGLRVDAGLGPDNLSAAVLRAGGFATTLIFRELLAAIFSARHVPIAWRG